jgi:hypothetical protein
MPPVKRPTAPPATNGHAAPPLWRINRADCLNWLAALPEGEPAAVVCSEACRDKIAVELAKGLPDSQGERDKWGGY